MSRLAVFGASGHGRVVADAAMETGWAEVVFYDDRWPGVQATGDWRVLGDWSQLLEAASDVDGVIVGIGDCRVRAMRHSSLVEVGARLAQIVHPRGWVSSRAVLGPGSIVMAGGMVNIGAVIGAACIVNTGATVDHDCIIGDAVHIAPGAHLAGQVTVGHRTLIGVGASIRHCIRIGSEVVVGAGAVVVSDVADGMTVAGSPARTLERRRVARKNA